ncbi:unnamed protein product [Didymodactylos carnosus]|uniref:Uncharacterized protein n=1 Tax=Didymodactylos carnosus TaxID=1234261 RepID=A0A815QXM6_9BILA|nr:unnamed protein product [Didymodactylos carnosus]CAF1467865.1 unnamed protein product [Didymodactylos carnosus]CAF3963819.1 unnamed protein product [Didymodactylos carnosus]CAF4336552.1 unnamed protein product [Didymodactylos carnosus]
MMISGQSNKKLSESPRTVLPGLSWKGLKQNYSLVPLLLITVCGVSIAGFSLLRWLIKNPSTSLTHHHSPGDRPEDKVETEEGYKNTKLIHIHDYRQIKHDPDRPKLD